MPWRGPVAGSPYLDDQFPSLGWGLAEWLDEVFWWQPLTDEQTRKIVHCYRIDAEGRRVYRRGQLMGPKGTGKSPEAARFSIGELEGPVQFDGWDANGEPVGRPRVTPTPWVQIAAVSLDQTDNTYGALLQLLTEHDGQAADALGLDPGDTRTVRRSNHRARIDKVTASAGAREGQPITAAVKDETHLWTPTNGGVKLSRTIDRNLGKMDGFGIETTNAYDPSLHSVAQATDEAVEQKADGIYQWKPTAQHVVSLADTGRLRRSLRQLYQHSPWVDVERLIEEIRDPVNTEADSRRFYLNEIWAGADAAWDAETWKARRHPEALVEPPAGDLVALGFDGARFHDSTALIGVRLEDRHEFMVGIWEKPHEVDDDDWEVPATDVDEAMVRAFDTWKIAAAYCDPPYWQDQVDAWDGRYSVVRKWWTNRDKPMAYAVQAFNELLVSDGCTHDGDERLTAHHLNAQKRATQIKTEDGKFLWTIQKKAPKSPLKIDARVSGILAHTAAADAIAAGALKVRKRLPNAFV